MAYTKVYSEADLLGASPLVVKGESFFPKEVLKTGQKSALESAVKQAIGNQRYEQADFIEVDRILCSLKVPVYLKFAFLELSLAASRWKKMAAAKYTEEEMIDFG